MIWLASSKLNRVAAQVMEANPSELSVALNIILSHTIGLPMDYQLGK